MLEEGLVNGTERVLRKRFESTWGVHKLVVDFGCDSVAEDVRDIDFEDGSGHGGSLRIFHFTREPGDTYDLRAIAYNDRYNPGIFYARTTIEAKKLDAALPAARVAMLAKMHDVSLYRGSSISLGASTSFSSNDFHLRVRIADSTGNFLDRGFTGYQSSYDQEARLPMELAAEPLQTALAKITFAKDVPTQADRELFVRHFLVTFDQKPSWWVGERLLEMAPVLGSADIVPAIVDWLVQGDKRDTRIREEAVAALAAITGLDLRKDEGNADRPLEEVIADYVRECG